MINIWPTLIVESAVQTDVNWKYHIVAELRGN